MRKFPCFETKVSADFLEKDKADQKPKPFNGVPNVQSSTEEDYQDIYDDVVLDQLQKPDDLGTKGN